jgi:hypothetical protein
MKTIVDLIPKLEGWCDVPKAITLYNLVLATFPKTIVEIGVFGGRSAIPMMMACKENGFGNVNCVDPWSSTASVEGQIGDEHKKYWASVDHDKVFENFQAAVITLNLTGHCLIHRLKSSDYTPPFIIDLLHVDGNHGVQAMEDTIKYAERVPHGGYVCLDDCAWVGGFVGKSAEWLKQNGFIELHPLGTGALFYKV